jgi:hypothetical protein
MIESSWVLRTIYDADDFDYDGGGDYVYTEVVWKEFKTEDDVLKYLQKEIIDIFANEPIHLPTIGEYVDTYGFQVFKRIH